MRRNGFSPNRIGAVEKRRRRFSLGAGKKGVWADGPQGHTPGLLAPWSKDVAAAASAGGCCIWTRGQMHCKCMQVCLPATGSAFLPNTWQPTGMPAAFTGEEIPCRPKGWPAFRGRPRNRDFSRKKRFCPTYVLAASEICLTQISTPRLGLWGNFPAGRRRQRRNRPFAVNQHKENGDSTPPIRRRRKTLTAFFAWCRETGRFASFDALIKGRGRTRPFTGCTIPFCGQTSPKICAGMSAGEPEGKNLPVKRARPAAKPGFFPRKSRGRTVPGFSVSKNWLADSKLHKCDVPYGTSGHPRRGGRCSA